METVRDISRKAYRNEKLSARFYFYSELIGLKFSRCLQLLEREFDISESRICDIIAENSQFISHLKNSNFTTNDLKKYYPYLSWNYPQQSAFEPTVKQLRLAL